MGSLIFFSVPAIARLVIYTPFSCARPGNGSASRSFRKSAEANEREKETEEGEGGNESIRRAGLRMHPVASRSLLETGKSGRVR